MTKNKYCVIQNTMIKPEFGGKINSISKSQAFITSKYLLAHEATVLYI